MRKKEVKFLAKAMMERRRRVVGGGRTKTAKTGSAWSVLNNNNCLYCFRDDFNVSERRRRQKYTFDLVLLRPVYSSWLEVSRLPSIYSVVFSRDSRCLFFVEMVTGQPTFHPDFTSVSALLYERIFMRHRQKSISRREMEVSLFPSETCKTCKGYAARIKQIWSSGCHLTDEAYNIFFSSCDFFKKNFQISHLFTQHIPFQFPSFFFNREEIRRKLV